MLVLTRSANQSIVIDEEIVVTVLDVRGEHVRIGISAPDHIQIHRQEVFEAVQEANRRAAESSGDLSSLGGLADQPAAGAAATDAVRQPGPRSSRRGETPPQRG